MDSQGFNKLNVALRDAGIEAVVVPEPGEDEDVRFVTIETDAAKVPPAHILNALAAKGLMHYNGLHYEVAESSQFEIVGMQPGSITLDDITVGPGLYGLQDS